MLYPLWTAKPGSGCSTTALALAVAMAGKGRDVLLVDLDGDLAAAAGIATQPDGVTDWLAASGAGDDSLRRLEHGLTDGLALLPRGSAHRWDDARGELVHKLLLHEMRAVVVDVSTVHAQAVTSMQRLRRRFAAADPSLLVTRPCYLALRRAETVGVRPTGIVLLREPGREIDRFTVAHQIGAPVVAQIDHDPAVARAVDRGCMVRRPPRGLTHQLRSMAR